MQACKADSKIIFNETLADHQIVQVICIFTGNLMILTFFWERNYVKNTLTIYLSRITITLQKQNGIRSSFWSGKRKSWCRGGTGAFRPLWNICMGGKTSHDGVCTDAVNTHKEPHGALIFTSFYHAVSNGFLFHLRPAEDLDDGGSGPLKEKGWAFLP